MLFFNGVKNLSDKNTFKNSRLKLKSFISVSLFSAVIAVCSFFSIPFAVPFTMQLFGVFSALYLLGGKRGTLSICLYVFLGALGLPVFSGFTGGIGKILDLTGGFITGFIISGIVFWIFTSLFKGKRSGILGLFLSLPACYLTGALWYAFHSGGELLPSLKGAFITCILPFIIPDLLKIALAVFVSEKIKKHKFI